MFEEPYCLDDILKITFMPDDKIQSLITTLKEHLVQHTLGNRSLDDDEINVIKRKLQIIDKCHKTQCKFTNELINGE